MSSQHPPLNIESLRLDTLHQLRQQQQKKQIEEISTENDEDEEEEEEADIENPKQQQQPHQLDDDASETSSEPARNGDTGVNSLSEEEDEEDEDLESGAEDRQPLVSSRDRIERIAPTSPPSSTYPSLVIKSNGSINSNPSSSSTSSTAVNSASSKLASASKNHLHSVDASLDRTTRALAATELFGSLTSSTLLNQREQFMKQRANLEKTNEHLRRSKTLLQRMRYRLVTDHIVQGVIILGELCTIALIIWIKYYKKAAT